LQRETRAFLGETQALEEVPDVLAQPVAAHGCLQEGLHERARALGQGVRGGDGRGQGGIFVVGLGLALESLEAAWRAGPPRASSANACRNSSMRPMRASTVRECGRLMWT